MERSPALVSSLFLPFLLLLLAPAHAQTQCDEGLLPCIVNNTVSGMEETRCYNPLQYRCSVTDKRLCGASRYNASIDHCLGLCMERVYDPYFQYCHPLYYVVCMKGELVNTSTGACYKPLCGETPYNPELQVCVDGVICPKGYLPDSAGQCYLVPVCGGVPYDPTTQVCFGALLCASGELLNTTSGECFKAPLCDMLNYDPQIQICYNNKTVCLIGQLLDAAGQCFQAPLCGLVSYDPDLNVCHGTVLCNKGQLLNVAGSCFDPPLCGEEPYDPEVKVCISGVLCSQGQLLDNTTRQCYDTELCGSVVFDPVIQQCFDNGTVCAANASWCPSSPPTPGSCYDSTTEECFGGVVCPKGQLLDPLSHECVDSAVCGGIVYDIATQVCLNGTICAFGWEACAGVCFNPTAQVCLEDRVICQLGQQLCFSQCFSVATHVCLSSGLCSRDKLCSGREGEGCMTNTHAQVCFSGRICRKGHELCPAAVPDPETGDPGGPGGCLPGNFRCNKGRVCNAGRKTIC